LFFKFWTHRKAQARKSKLIDQELKQEKSRLKVEKIPSLLLLGGSDSGKTTFLKQIKIIYGTGFTDEERRHFRLVIISNIINSIRILILAMKIFSIPYENQENEVCF